MWLLYSVDVLKCNFDICPLWILDIWCIKCVGFCSRVVSSALIRYKENAFCLHYVSIYFLLLSYSSRGILNPPRGKLLINLGIPTTNNSQLTWFPIFTLQSHLFWVFWKYLTSTLEIKASSLLSTSKRMSKKNMSWLIREQWGIHIHVFANVYIFYRGLGMLRRGNLKIFESLKTLHDVSLRVLRNICSWRWQPKKWITNHHENDRTINYPNSQSCHFVSNFSRENKSLV